MVVLFFKATPSPPTGAPTQDIVFMSGGTEANNAVFHCAVTQFYKWRMSTPTHQHLRPHVITTKVEHDAVLLPLTCRYAMEAG